MNEKLAIFTIISKNYLAYARTLMASVKIHYPHSPLYICLADKIDGYFDPGKELFEVVEAEQLDIPDFNRFTFRYEIIELNTAVKPFMFKWLLENTDCEAVIYLDPDILVLHKLDHVEEILDQGALAVLTPHICEPMPDDNKDPREVDLLRTGTFNLGFFALARHFRATKLLDWWCKRLTYDCRVDLEGGLFVDQKWMDLLPSFFNDVQILRQPTYNVAYWNLMHRPVQKKNGCWMVHDAPLRFFHFSGININEPNQFSKHQTRFSLHNIGELKKLYFEYINKVKKHDFDKCSQWPYAYGTFGNGQKITTFVRMVYREDVERASKCPPDPFNMDLEFFNQPSPEVPQTAEILITRLMYKVWKIRKDLQAAYNLSTLQGRGSFVAWYLASAKDQLGLGDRFITPVIARTQSSKLGKPITRQGSSNVRFQGSILSPLSGAYWNQFILKNYKKLKFIYKWFNIETRIKVKSFLLRNAFGIKMDQQAVSDQSRDIQLVQTQQFIQVFYKAKGEGFAEEKSLTQYFDASEDDLFELEFTLNAPATDIRIDFPGYKGHIYSLDWVDVITSSGQINVNLIGKKNALHHLERKDHEFLVQGENPHIKIPLFKENTPIRTVRVGGRLIKSKRSIHQSEVQEILFHEGLKKGSNLIGYPRAETGMGQHVRSAARAFIQTSIPFIINNLKGENDLPQQDTRYDKLISSEFPYRTNIFYINADEIEYTICCLGKKIVGTRYNIGYWMWELSEFPKIWLNQIGMMNEIWAPSTFTQNAITPLSHVPVVHMPLAVDFEPPKGYDRQYFRLPDNKFLFLFSFDFGSYFSRKNPLACIQAFKKAFPNKNQPVGMVIKTMRKDQNPEDYQRLLLEVGDDPRVTVFNSILTSEEILGLAHVCDSFVSLHRSEGFGLGLAEGMLLGKPVIATNYSGNTDFMRQDNSCLVDFELIPIGENEYPFGKGQVWANPDIDHASWHMKRLFNEPDFAKKMGRAGQKNIKKNNSARVIGQRYEKRLKFLGLA